MLANQHRNRTNTIVRIKVRQNWLRIVNLLVFIQYSIHEKQPLANGCLSKKGYLYLFTQFFEFVSHKLNFRTDDHLYGGLAGSYDTCNTC